MPMIIQLSGVGACRVQARIMRTLPYHSPTTTLGLTPLVCQTKLVVNYKFTIMMALCFFTFIPELPLKYVFCAMLIFYDQYEQITNVQGNFVLDLKAVMVVVVVG